MIKKTESEPILVYVSVHPVLIDYIVSVYGTDIIVPDDKSALWVTVKSHLIVVPNDYKPHPAGPEPGAIRIALPPISASSPIYNFQVGQTIVTNYLFRNCLAKSGQKAVADLLMKSFKEQYRAFMAGYLATHPKQSMDSQIKDGIDEFCRIYNIRMDENITYEMLRKDWYRFRTRDSVSDFCDAVKENI